MPKKTKTPRIVILTGAAIAVAVIGVVSYVAFESEPLQSPAGNASSQSDVIALGRAIYASQCAACHGANLEGQPNWRQRKANGRMPAPPHDETGHTWHHNDATLFNLTKYGLSALVGQKVETDMPAYEGVLNDEQIRAALAYIKSRWPEEIQQRHSEMSRRATPAGS